MYQYYANGACVEQYQQQVRREAAEARGIAVLEKNPRKELVIAGLTYVRLLVAAFKSVVTLRLA